MKAAGKIGNPLNWDRLDDECASVCYEVIYKDFYSTILCRSALFSGFADALDVSDLISEMHPDWFVEIVEAIVHEPSVSPLFRLAGKS